MKYIIKCWALGVAITAGCITACSDKYAIDEDDMYSNAQNVSRTELVEKMVLLTNTDRLESLVGSEKTTLEKLIIIGTLLSDDIEFLREELPLLTVLDLKDATLENNTIPQNFITDNSMLEEVILPKNLEVIYYSAFLDCSALKKVVMYEGLTDIYGSAFTRCKSLKDVVLPQSLSSIGSNCFNGTALDSLKLGENIKSIDSYAFSESGLKYVDFDCINASFGDAIFKNCKKLEKIDLHEGLKTIPPYFLSGCSKIKEIVLPDSLNVIMSEAFRETSITEITLHSGIKQIYNSAFYSCNKLKRAVINSTPEFSGGNTFQNCTELEEVILNNEIKTIPYQFLSGCNKLTSIVLPDSISEIESHAFDNSGIRNIDLKNVKTLGSYAFNNTKIKNITIPESVTEVSYNLLEECDSLEYVEWKSSADIPYLFYNSYNKYAMIFVDTNNDSIPKIDDRVKNMAIIDNHIDSLCLNLESYYWNFNFKLPRKVTFRKLVFRKNFERGYYYVTEPGKAVCWKTITLPVAPTSIVTVDNGRILAPFNTEMDTEYCPFWLRKLTDNGFEDTTEFEAYRPYIVHMPYNPNLYIDEYNINTYVDFIAENGVLEPTPETFTPDTGMGMSFWPNIKKQGPDGLKYVLNDEEYFNNNYGNCFVRSSYDVYPFEAYITTSSSMSGQALNLDNMFGNGKSAGSRAAKTTNNTGKPQIDDL